MTHAVSAITWTDTAEQGNAIANYAVNFATDPDWQFTLLGSYHFQALAPAGVSIDNSANAAALTVSIGAISTAIPAFQRSTLGIPRGSQLLRLQSTAGQTVPIQFFVKAELPDLLAAFQSQLQANLQTVTQLVRSYLAGYNFSVDAISPNTVVDISAGSCIDSTEATTITLGNFTKSIAGGWMAGSGATGLGTGVVVPTPGTLHAFAINNSGVSDIYFDSSPGAANAPAGTTASRRVFSFRTNNLGNIIGMVQDGDYFYYVGPQVDISGGVTANVARALDALTVPTGILVEVIYSVHMVSPGGSFGTLIFTCPQEIDTAATAAFDIFAVAAGAAAGRFQTLTNTSGQIGIRANVAGVTLDLFTRGFLDYRGRFN